MTLWKEGFLCLCHPGITIRLSAGFNHLFVFLGKHILHFYLKLKPLGHPFASYSVLSLSFSASSSSYCPTFLAGCALDLLQSCHDNFCLRLRGSEAGQTCVCVCVCVCASVCVCLTAQVVSVTLSASKTKDLLHEWKLTKLL